jgi:putative membrane protein
MTNQSNNETTSPNQHRADNTQQANDNTSEQWRRIHPIALLYFAIQFIQQLLGNFVYALPALIFLYEHILENPVIWLTAIAIALTLLIGYVLLAFYHFSYRLNADTVEIRSGILHKHYLNLPFDRIQNITLEQPIYYRPWQFTCLQLDSAGSNKQEAKIIALTVAEAESLKAQILAFHQHKNTNKEHKEDIPLSQTTTLTTDKTIQQPTEQLLITRSLTDLFIHGLTNNRVWIFIGALAPFLDNALQQLTKVTQFLNIPIDFEHYFDKPLWQVALYSFTLFIVLLTIIAIISIVGAIISFYGFTLTKVNDRYIRRSGLLTKHELTMRLSRLQMVIQQQDWLDRLLGRMNLLFEQVNHSQHQLAQHSIGKRLIVPSVKTTESQQLLADALPNNQLHSIIYHAISPLFLVRYGLLMLLPLATSIIAFLLYHQNYHAIAFALPFLLFICLLIFCRWRRWGFNYDQQYLYVRSGIFGVDFRCMPLYKIQQVKIEQSILLKKQSLCHVTFVLASGKITIPFISEKQAIELLDYCLFQVEYKPKSWL